MLIRLFRFLQAIIARLPRSVGLALCILVGDLCYWFGGAARRRATANLYRVLAYDLAGGPARPINRRMLQHMVRQSFRNQAGNYYDMLRMPSRTLADLNSLVDVVGLDHVDQVLAAGRGMLLIGIHLGSLDYGPLPLTARGYQVIIPVELIRNQALLDYINGLRSSHGYQMVPSEPRTLRLLLKALRQNAVIGLVSDRDLAGTGVPVTFFGAPTTLPSGPAVLAIRTGTPILHGYCLRGKDGRYTSYVQPPFDISDLLTGDFEADVAAVTQRLAHIFEASIQQHPDHWAAFNRVWKT